MICKACDMDTDHLKISPRFIILEADSIMNTGFCCGCINPANREANKLCEALERAKHDT